MSAETTATITCPVCATQAVEAMPTNACRYFYACTGCGALLKPTPGDCCVFCSYADTRCPSKQTAQFDFDLTGGRRVAQCGTSTI